MQGLKLNQLNLVKMPPGMIQKGIECEHYDEISWDTFQHDCCGEAAN